MPSFVQKEQDKKDSVLREFLICPGKADGVISVLNETNGLLK